MDIIQSHCQINGYPISPSQINGYPISIIDKSFKTFLDQLYFKRSQVLTAKKKTSTLVLSCLGTLSKLMGIQYQS